MVHIESVDISRTISVLLYWGWDWSPLNQDGGRMVPHRKTEPLLVVKGGVEHEYINSPITQTMDISPTRRWEGSEMKSRRCTPQEGGITGSKERGRFKYSIVIKVKQEIKENEDWAMFTGFSTEVIVWVVRAEQDLNGLRVNKRKRSRIFT